ncbi:type VI secretion system-associated FHA domain protein [Roseibium sp.]|uniref:type VI secretion system-associated FHA domain protein n=1 Tax=Roseibium sp. TaxID=1936156 RepID=UPI003264BD1E
MTASLVLVCDTIGSRHQFGPGGGAFGRSRKCDWVLPDQDRHLSSVHARVLYQNDTFVLVDESTNGTFLDGQKAAIGRGKAVSLSVGMTLLAGPYQIRVESLQSGPATQTNPFASLQANTAGRPAPSAAPLRIDTSGASLPQTASLDPLDHLGGGTELLQPVASVQAPVNAIPEPVAFSAPLVPASPHETTRFQPVQPQLDAPPVAAPAPLHPSTASPLPGLPVSPADMGGSAQQPAQAPAQPMMPSPAHAPPPATRPAAPVSAGPAIPEDFLAGLAAPATPAPPGFQQPGLPDLAALMPAQAPASGAAPLAQTSTIPEHVDFGFGAPTPASDPPARMPSGPEPALPPASGDAAHPQAGSGQAGVPLAGAMPAGVMPAGVMPPDVMSSDVMPGGVMPEPPAPASAGSDTPLDPLDALKKRRAQREAELAQKAKTRVAPQMPARTGQMPAPSQTPVSPLANPPSGPPSGPLSGPPSGTRPPAVQDPVTPAAASGSSPDPEVFQALLAGLGFADADVPKEAQAEIARATGEMVQELANGLIALLDARKSLKTEFRMYETRIQPEENNPFKHFNVGELAIDEMLFARKGGFLAPAEAAKEAFKDLQSHTMLTVAATQRAMRILFESLSPETLAGEEDDGGLRIRGLGSRRGKWDAAKERHDRLRGDFDAVVRQTIAEAFVQVEEDQARQQSKTFWENRNK